MRNTVRINNTTIVGARNISISNGIIIVDGNDMTPEGKNITISVEGNIESIKADACAKIDVTGDVGQLSTMSGDVRCGAVSGSVKTMSGDVICGPIGGSVNTMSGDISHN